MSGYFWAKTADGALLVVLMTDGRGFVPGREDAIKLDEISFLEPVKWPSPFEIQNRSSAPPNCGAHAPAVAHECVILPFAANG